MRPSAHTYDGYVGSSGARGPVGPGRYGRRLSGVSSTGVHGGVEGRATGVTDLCVNVGGGFSVARGDASVSGRVGRTRQEVCLCGGRDGGAPDPNGGRYEGWGPRTSVPKGFREPTGGRGHKEREGVVVLVFVRSPPEHTLHPRVSP